MSQSTETREDEPCKFSKDKIGRHLAYPLKRSLLDAVLLSTSVCSTVDAEKSDIFDVLAYVACALPPLTREERAGRAKVEITSRFNSRQEAFLDFVLAVRVQQTIQASFRLAVLMISFKLCLRSLRRFPENGIPFLIRVHSR